MPPRVRETIGVVVIIVWRVNKVINSDNNNDIDDGVYKWRAGGVLGCLSLSLSVLWIFDYDQSQWFSGYVIYVSENQN